MKAGGFAERYPRLLSAYRVLPNLKRLGPHNAIIHRLHEMAPEAKQILGESVEREKPMSMSRRGKPTHVNLFLGRGILNAIFGQSETYRRGRELSLTPILRLCPPIIKNRKII